MFGAFLIFILNTTISFRPDSTHFQVKNTCIDLRYDYWQFEFFQKPRGFVGITAWSLWVIILVYFMTTIGETLKKSVANSKVNCYKISLHYRDRKYTSISFTGTLNIFTYYFRCWQKSITTFKKDVDETKMWIFSTRNADVGSQILLFVHLSTDILHHNPGANVTWNYRKDVIEKNAQTKCSIIYSIHTYIAIKVAIKIILTK